MIGSRRTMMPLRRTAIATLCAAGLLLVAIAVQAADEQVCSLLPNIISVF